MKFHVSTVAFAALWFFGTVVAVPSNLEGYATLNGGTTGGAGGPTVVVSNIAALRTAVAGTNAQIIRINGIISGDGERVDVGSNKSILGGCGGGLTGSGFRVKEGRNVIFRNLKIYLSRAPNDLIEIQESTNVWVDHNEFYNDLNNGKDYYDGATDINHGSDFITVSWNYYHDSFKTSLVGHSDNNASEDQGHLKVTYHHNYFFNLGSRLPSLRFGTGHVYNNYYKDISIGGIDSRMGAQMLIENNVFQNAVKPLMTVEEGGYAVVRGNDWGGATPELNPGSLNSVPYSYSLEATTSTTSSVLAGAGTCKIDPFGGTVNPPVTTPRTSSTARTSSSVRVSSSSSSRRTTSTTRAASSTSPNGATQTLYGQCGGSGYTGPTVCAQGVCTFSNEWYSQCVPA